MKKIFISHYHTDAPRLASLKEHLLDYGFECFLAHEDIEPGEHDLTVIGEKIHDCDFFLYVVSVPANQSAFCQQEIGMARGLDKPIITVRTDDQSPLGFIGRIQAMRSRGLTENISCLAQRILLHQDIKSHLSPEKIEILKALQDLNISGFSVSELEKENTIFLKKNGWNDYGFETRFGLFYKNKDIGWIMIGFKGMVEGDSVTEHFPSDVFSSLGEKFFSRISLDNNLPENIRKTLSTLLRDLCTLDKTSLDEIIDENVLQSSLFRDDYDGLRQLKEKYSQPLSFSKEEAERMGAYEEDDLSLEDALDAWDDLEEE